MAANDGYPVWLLESKKTISKSQDWKEFVSKLQDSIELQLVENHVPDFRDLSPTERLLFIERAAKSMQSNVSYDAIYDQMSLALDQQINNDVAKEMMTSFTTGTKTNLLMDHLRDGSVSILRRWPEMKNKLHMCLNMSLPEKLRTITWTLFLTDPRVRHDFVEQLRVSPNKLLSPHDRKITEKCDQILRIQNTFLELRPPNVGALSAMRATLSHYHAVMKSDDELHHVYYLLILPLLQLASPHLNKTQRAPDSTVALLVDMFFGLLRDVPLYIADVYNAHSNISKTFAEKVAQHLENTDQELVVAMIEKELDDDDEGVEALESTVRQQILVNVIREVAGSLIMSLFVGFLNADLLMFVWDQYIIGLDVGGYHLAFLSTFMATLLSLLREDLIASNDIAEMVGVVQRDSVKLNVKLVQQKMRQKFYKILHSELNQDEKAAIPVINPTHVTGKMWAHWNNELLPGRTKPLDRQLARDAREEERKRLAEHRQKTEADEKLALAEKQRLLDKRRKDAADQEKLDIDMRNRRLEELLEDEKRSRLKDSQEHKDELAKLKLEIDRLRNRSPTDASLNGSLVLLAPPPTRNTSPPGRRKSSLLPEQRPNTIRTVPPSPTNSNDRTAHDIVLDLVKAISSKYNKLAHADGTDQEQLDDRTKQDIRRHRDDVKEAERELFGHYLEPGEFEKLPADEQQAKSDDMMDIVRRRLEYRRARELREAL